MSRSICSDRVRIATLLPSLTKGDRRALLHVNSGAAIIQDYQRLQSLEDTPDTLTLEGCIIAFCLIEKCFKEIIIADCALGSLDIRLCESFRLSRHLHLLASCAGYPGTSEYSDEIVCLTNCFNDYSTADSVEDLKVSAHFNAVRVYDFVRDVLAWFISELKAMPD